MKSEYSQDLNEKLTKTKTLEDDLTASKHQLLAVKVSPLHLVVLWSMQGWKCKFPWNFRSISCELLPMFTILGYIFLLQLMNLTLAGEISLE